MTIKLSVCIPTYNRAIFLGETLESIIEQATDEMEIVISDNASEDNTKEIVEQYKKVFHRITYYCQPKNMGADCNYLKIVELARGEYCWLLGSDDALSQGAISRIFSEIKYGYDIYLCNRIDCNYYLQPIRKFHILNSTGDRVFDFSQRGELVDYFNRANALGAVFSYLSSIVVKKLAWESINYDSSMTGTAYSHAYILTSLIAGGAKLKYLQDAMIMCRFGNDSFAQGGDIKRFMIDIDGYIKIADKLFVDEEVKSAFLKIMSHEHPWYRIAKIKYFSKANWQEIRSLLYLFGYDKFTLIVVEVIASIPYLVGLMLMIKRRFSRFS